jgi:hypothetical protein
MHGPRRSRSQRNAVPSKEHQTLSLRCVAVTRHPCRATGIPSIPKRDQIPYPACPAQPTVTPVPHLLHEALARAAEVAEALPIVYDAIEAVRLQRVEHRAKGRLHLIKRRHEVFHGHLETTPPPHGKASQSQPAWNPTSHQELIRRTCHQGNQWDTLGPMRGAEQVILSLFASYS